jgi:hypothetical protein
VSAIGIGGWHLGLKHDQIRDPKSQIGLGQASGPVEFKISDLSEIANRIVQFDISDLRFRDQDPTIFE